MGLFDSLSSLFSSSSSKSGSKGKPGAGYGKGSANTKERLKNLPLSA